MMRCRRYSEVVPFTSRIPSEATAVLGITLRASEPVLPLVMPRTLSAGRSRRSGSDCGSPSVLTSPSSRFSSASQSGIASSAACSSSPIGSTVSYQPSTSTWPSSSFMEARRRARTLPVSGAQLP